MIALYGPNGAGKTNVLEALSMLSPGRGIRRSASDDLMRRPEEIGWKVEAALDVPSVQHEISTFAEPGNPRQVQIDGKSASQAALGRLMRVLWLVPAMDRLWTDTAEGRRRFLDRVTLSFEPDHGSAAVAYEKAMRQRNRLFRDEVDDPGWLDALERQMAASGAAIAQARARAIAALADAQDAAGPFPVADLTISSGDDMGPLDDEETLAAALHAGRMRDRAAGRTLIGPHRADLAAVYQAKGVAARDCSTGEQKALLISIVLANARALLAQHGTAPVLLLDEVAAHLDVDRRGALYAEIETLGAQCWMTGTGVELFAEIANHAALWQVTDDSGASVVEELEDRS